MKLRPYHSLQVGLLILAFLMITGCVAAIKGENVKTYGSEYFETVQTSIDTLVKFKVKIDEETSHEIKTSIKAIRPEGVPVWIEITQIDQGVTQVGVRVGSVGSRDPKLSEQIQDMIGESLNNMKAEAESRLNENQDLIKSTEFSDPNTIDLSPFDDLTEYNYLEFNDEFTIFFYHYSIAISDDQIEKLNRIAQHIIEKPNAKVIVHGYTDSSGGADYNKYISESRAASIRAYLVAKGIEPGNIKIFGHGGKAFISNNDTVEGRNKNRRVEIVVSP